LRRSAISGPIVDERSMTQQPREQPAGEGPHAALSRRGIRGLSILLAEDTPANQKLFREILVRCGHRVMVVGNGRDAVRQFEREAYDVVLLDLQLPVLSGLRAAAAIRASRCGRADVPIVAMTAHAMHGDRERCLAVGINGYLAKPIDASELVRVVEHAAGIGPNADGATTCDEDLCDSNGGAPAADTVPAEGPFLDLAGARQRMGGNDDLLRDMGRFLIEDSPKLLRELIDAVALEDSDRSARAAHSLRGLAANFGAARCLSVATQIEADCRDGVFEPVKRDVADLRREIQALTAAIECQLLR
jgi:CheY-like chemotaxis protein